MKSPRLHLIAFQLLIAGTCSPLLTSFARADVVTDWNTAMTHASEILPAPGIPPFLESRLFAMAHIAMFNAVSEITPHHSEAGAKSRGNAIAAAAQAAHDVLVNQPLGSNAAFDELLAQELATIPSGADKDRGIAVGAAAAAAMLRSRANDGSATAEHPYTPGTNPGDYQFTPPFDGPPFNGYAAVPKWGQVTPFVMKTGSQFRCGPPYRVGDLAYTFDLTEIAALGSANSADRTPDQKALALFWYENCGMGWNRIARELAGQQSNSVLEHARLFASLNAALADGYISAIEAKYTYNFWRPITAIRRADADGNELTHATVDWEPLFLTPPVPDYPSAHACAGGAAAAVLISFFGDNRTFTIPSTMAVPFPIVQPRTFHSISDAAKENALSRMLVGIHFRNACLTGLEQGEKVGNWVVKHASYANSH